MATNCSVVNYCSNELSASRKRYIHAFHLKTWRKKVFEECLSTWKIKSWKYIQYSLILNKESHFKLRNETVLRLAFTTTNEDNFIEYLWSLLNYSEFEIRKSNISCQMSRNFKRMNNKNLLYFTCKSYIESALSVLNLLQVEIRKLDEDIMYFS